MSCEVAALPFKAHANYGTWSIDFGSNWSKIVFKQNTANRQISQIMFGKYMIFVLYIML